jgi:hypothetical protein
MIRTPAAAAVPSEADGLEGLPEVAARGDDCSRPRGYGLGEGGGKAAGGGPG